MTGLSSLREFLGITIQYKNVPYEVLDTFETGQFNRQLIKYKGSEDDDIWAYMFWPKKQKILGSVLVHHQHNGERHFGKSEVAGLVGDPFQHFCPALAARGIISLAPDSICFEDRRSTGSGTQAAADPDDDWLQHYNEMCYRLLRGEGLMKKVVEDSSIGLSILAHMEEANPPKLGILGHSYGGNTVIFHAALDERIQYSCSSGAVCNYKNKMEHGTGIEMAEVIPGFYPKYDIGDLLQMVAPRSLLILCAEEDIYSRDAKNIYNQVKKFYQNAGVESNINLKAYQGGHALTGERFADIIHWFEKKYQAN